VIFSCDRCGRRYSVSDERVQGRAFRANCKACGHTFVVRPAPPATPAPVVDLAAALAEERRRRAPPPVEDEGAADPFASVGREWMADPPRSAGGAETGAPAPAGRPEAPHPAPLRVALAAAVLGLALAGATWLVWPGERATPPAPAPPVAAVAPIPQPATAPPPSSATAATPAPAPAPAPAPPASLEASGATAAARFEPDGVTVAPSRRKQAHALSRKDRGLLDLLARKADEAPPPEPVEALDLDTGRALDPAAVLRVVRENQGAFSGCIARSARADQGKPSRRATLLLTVDASGAVSSAWLAEAELSRTLLGRCVVKAARRLAFPAFDGEAVDVSVPLLLEAR
jgi:hypothetical protein